MSFFHLLQIELGDKWYVSQSSLWGEAQREQSPNWAAEPRRVNQDWKPLMQMKLQGDFLSAVTQLGFFFPGP